MKFSANTHTERKMPELPVSHLKKAAQRRKSSLPIGTNVAIVAVGFFIDSIIATLIRTSVIRGLRGIYAHADH